MELSAQEVLREKKRQVAQAGVNVHLTARVSMWAAS
jgi:hypothetical protein